MKGTFSNLKRGFTLVELVVVIAIIAILSGVGFAAYSGYVEYAQKGVDRQTVGEIMEAMELAGYSNPELLSDGKTALIFITTNGTFTDDVGVKSAIEDAFGDLSSVKLSSDSWQGINGDIVSQLNKSESRLEDYMEHVKTNPKASFASDFYDYWEIYKNVTNLLITEGIDVAGNGTPLKIDPSSYDEKSMTGHILATYSSGTVNSEKLISAWSSDMAIAGEVEDVAFGGFDLELARNYAFLSYAQGNETVLSDEGLIEDITEYADQLARREHIASPFLNNDIFKNGANSDDWNKIITAYLRDQAPSDARAYLALMECGGLVYADYAADGKTPSDDELGEALGGYVTLTGSVMDGTSELSDIQDMLKAGDQAITITVKRNSDGTMIVKPNPKDASPKAESAANTAAPEEPEEPAGECTKTDEHTGRIYVETNKNIGALKASTEKVSDSTVGKNVTEITVCSIDESAKTCVIELLEGVSNGRLEVTDGDGSCIDISGLTISAVKKGTCKVILHATGTKGEKPITFTVVVH